MIPMKQVLVMREDLGMSAGKLAAQAAHASIAAYDVVPKDNIEEWKRSGTTKIVLSVLSEEQLLSIYKDAVVKCLPAALICDEGRTEIAPGTMTGVGIGPAPSDWINEVTGHLRLYGKKEAGTG